MTSRALLLLLLLALLAGCGSSGDGDESLLGPTAATPAGASERTLLARRAAAVRTGDEQAFLTPVVRDDPRFVAGQRRLFRNLRLLPLRDLAFRADGPHRVVRTLRLAGFDTGPTVGPAGFAVEHRAGRLVVVPAVGAAGQATDPWDLTAVRVQRDTHALLLYDAADASRAGDLLAAVSDGTRQVGAAVPGTWDRTAVVYAFRDPRVLASYAKVPGGSPAHLGALSYPLPRGAGSRVALLPAALDADEVDLRRVVRHELAHVAIGSRDDHVPVWLAEGLAEHVAARAVPVAKRRIPTVAVTEAQYGFDALPGAPSFNDDQQDLHYAEAWMACDYLADTRGEQVLWSLLDAMERARVGRAGHGQDAVLRAVTGLDGRQLAGRAAARITRLFGGASSPPAG